MRHIRPIWFGILLVALVYAVAVRFAELQQIFALFQRAEFAWVVVAVILQVGTYIASASTYRDILRTLDFHVRHGVMVRLYLAMTFLTHMLPVGGFSGSVYFTKALKRLGLPEGQGVAAALISIITGYLAFFILLIGGVFYLSFTHPGQYVRLTEVIAVLSIIIVFFIVVDRLVVYREKVTHFFEYMLKAVNAKKRRFLLFDRFSTFMDDLGEGRAMFLRSKRKFIAPTLYQLGVLLLDALTIFVIFLAFGERAMFSAIIVSYVLARFFGAISFLPGGLGSFEVAQIVTMKALGIPLATTTVVTLFFRLFSFWLPTPIGLYFYRKLEHNDVIYKDVVAGL
ncbi:hypothetical protein A3H11_02915 [Candidatus Uhrbacteria bacterium RIFCSPLOWO2_12_FULL_47_10]|nr:MAG: hypothetical protein A3H11_02915 [Candidatus Uhrbacteria bacterium RIFCSPLOWO2_12_FULL_47_10]